MNDSLMINENMESITSFRVAGEYFGVATMKIQHILEVSDITHVPLAPAYYMGVVNNHGNMIPVIDFRMLIGVDNSVERPEASIMVVSVDDVNTSLLGFYVDEVDDVFDIDMSTIEKSVALDINKDILKSITGTLKYNDRFVYFIDLQNLSDILEK